MTFSKQPFLSIHTEAASSLMVGEKEEEGFGARRSGLPEYTLDDVAKHNTMKTRVWMAYRHGVYDVTDFIAEHPGRSGRNEFINFSAVHICMSSEATVLTKF